MIVVAAVAAVIVVGLLHEQQTVCFVGQGLNSCPAHTSQSEISHTPAEGGAGKGCRQDYMQTIHCSSEAQEGERREVGATAAAASAYSSQTP